MTNQTTSLNAMLRPSPYKNDLFNKTLIWAKLLFFVYLLLVAVSAIGAGFKLAAGGAANAAELFAFATNPVAALMVGILATALLQSSSTSTSIIVGLVAGGLPISAAVPMIMGANIGTTVTNTIVSLGHVRASTDFSRAFAAATVHDFFNFLAVLILFPLELYTGVLSHSAKAIADLLASQTTTDMGSFNFIKAVTQPPVAALQSIFMGIGLGSGMAGILLTTGGIATIFMSISLTGRMLRQAMTGSAHKMMHAAIGRNAVTSIFSGALVTVLVQSSSTTTSLMIPFASTGLFKLRDIYPFTLGANIGTTVTALLASMAIGGPAGLLALQIALVHLLFNASAVLIIYVLPVLRDIPPNLAIWLANFAVKHKTAALAYVLAVFFGLPALLVVVTN